MLKSNDMSKPKTPMPPQIQKCHDVWANTLDGQLRIVTAMEIEELLEAIKAGFPPYRSEMWVRWKLYRLTNPRWKE